MEVHLNASTVIAMINASGPFHALAVPGFVVYDQTGTVVLKFSSAAYPDTVFIIDNGGCPAALIQTAFGGPTAPEGWGALTVNDLAG